MPVYLTPGVYVEEVYGSTQFPDPAWSPTDRATADDDTQILLVGPGAVAFMGMTERAPVARNGTSLAAMPVPVEGWEQYVDRFGGCLDTAYLPSAVRGFFANGGRRGYIVSLAALGPGADPPVLSVPDFHGDPDRRTGMAGLASLHDVTAICAPDLMVCLERGNCRREDVVQIQEALIAFSELRRSCTALLDTPPGLVPDAANRWRRETGFDRAHAALYYPWIYAGDDPDTALKVPPCGHVAGVLMRTYETHGPHATLANQAIADAVDLETRISPVEQDVLNPIGVNVLRIFPDATVRIWGTRTLSSDPGRRLLQDRILIQAIARSIEQGATWAIFRRDDARLREDIYLALYGFLRELWRRGVLVGDSEPQAFYVRPAEIEADDPFVVHIGFAMHTAGEFTPLRVVIASEQARSSSSVSATPPAGSSSGVSAPPRAQVSVAGPEIFLSYGREDWDEFVEGLVRMLRDEGFNVWVDQHLLRGGDDWMDAINEALARCPVMVLCLSPDAVASKHVKLEYRYFFNEGKPIVPVLCRPAVLPAEIRGLQHLPYSETAKLIAHLKEMSL